MINLDGARRAIERGIQEGLNEYVELVKPLITNSTPIDTGTLRQSERVDKIEDGRRFSANTDYATEQHEMNYPHTVGRSHYILSPLQETVADAQQILSNSVSTALSGGGR